MHNLPMFFFKVMDAKKKKKLMGARGTRRPLKLEKKQNGRLKKKPSAAPFFFNSIFGRPGSLYP